MPRPIVLVVSAAVIVLIISIAGSLVNFLIHAQDESLAVLSVDTSASIAKLASGTHSSVAARKNYLITSENQLRELWKLVDAGGSPPTVDFSIYQVLAVFTGIEPSAGYTIAITKVADGKERMVSVQITAPGVSCLAAKLVTMPYEIVQIPATTLAYTHKDTVMTTSCLQ